MGYRTMKKYRIICFTLLLILMANLTFGARALAETADSGSSDGSDCGCSDSGTGTYVGETSRRNAGYRTSADGIDESGQQEDQIYRAESDESTSLIWINLISFGVVAATFVMVVRYRKSNKKEQDADQDKGTPSGFGFLRDELNEWQSFFCEKTLINLTEQLFSQLQEALSAGNIKSLEPWLGRELYQRLDQQLRLNCTEERKKPTVSVEIRNARIVRYDNENRGDALNIRIQARLIKYAEPCTTGEVASERSNGDIFVVSVCTMERAKGETNWKLTQIRRESKEAV